MSAKSLVDKSRVSPRSDVSFPRILSYRGNKIGARGLRASERKSASERVSEREGSQRFLRGFERF